MTHELSLSTTFFKHSRDVLSLPTLSKYERNWLHSYIGTSIPGSSAHQFLFTLVRVQSPSARALKWPYKTTFLTTANSLHKMSRGCFQKIRKNGWCLPKVRQPDGGRDVVLTLRVLFVLLRAECLITKHKEIVIQIQFTNKQKQPNNKR